MHKFYQVRFHFKRQINICWIPRHLVWLNWAFYMKGTSDDNLAKLRCMWEEELDVGDIEKVINPAVKSVFNSMAYAARVDRVQGRLFATLGYPPTLSPSFIPLFHSKHSLLACYWQTIYALCFIGLATSSSWHVS